jgi:hypothetical protein
MLTFVAVECSVDHAPKVCSRSLVDVVRLPLVSQAAEPHSHDVVRHAHDLLQLAGRDASQSVAAV